MVRFMKATLSITWPLEKEERFMQMEIIIRGSIKRIKHMDLEPTNTKMARNTAAFGKIINRMVTELRSGLMETSMKVTMSMA